MNGNEHLIVAHAAGSSARREAFEYVNRIYWRVFRVIPPPADVIFVARRNGRIVGTLGFDYCGEGNDMPPEHLFSFDRKKTPLPFDCARSVQYGRWTADGPSISAELLYAVTAYALGGGMRYVWCEQKKNAARTLRLLGVTLHPVKDAVLKTGAVPESVRTYYLSEPTPRLYMFKLEQALSAASRKISLMPAAGALQSGKL